VGKSKGEESNGRAEAKAKAKATGCFFGNRPPKGAVALLAFNWLVDSYYAMQRESFGFTNEAVKARSFWNAVHSAEDRAAAIKAWTATHRIAPTEPAEAESGLVAPQGPEVANQEEGNEDEKAGTANQRIAPTEPAEAESGLVAPQGPEVANQEEGSEEEEEAYPSEKDDDEPGEDIS
jgi:hypothetical protein